MHTIEEFLPQKTIDLLQKQEYALFGHSSVKICHYTKTAILNKSACYKQKFYGIQSHQCIQMSPATAFCDQKCSYCWRPTQTFKPKFSREDGVTADAAMVDDPTEIVEASITAQLKQLSGFGGNPKRNQVKFEQSKTPRHVAISLTGEPTLYPRLPGLIDAYHAQGISTFVVSNALHPEMLEQLIDHPPTQLYLSIDSAIEDVHLKLNKPDIAKSFDRLKKSIALLPKIPTRSVIRMTVVKGINDNHVPEFAALSKTGNPDFVEIKSYMHVGYSQYRLTQEHMMNWDELQSFAVQVSEAMGYPVKLRDEGALVCLLVRPDWLHKSTIIPFREIFPEHYKTEVKKATSTKKK